MKVLDLLFQLFYITTFGNDSKQDRANFLLWFSTSFMLIALFYSSTTKFSNL